MGDKTTHEIVEKLGCSLPMAQKLKRDAKQWRIARGEEPVSRKVTPWRKSQEWESSPSNQDVDAR